MILNLGLSRGASIRPTLPVTPRPELRLTVITGSGLCGIVGAAGRGHGRKLAQRVRIIQARIDPRRGRGRGCRSGRGSRGVQSTQCYGDGDVPRHSARPNALHLLALLEMAALLGRLRDGGERGRRDGGARYVLSIGSPLLLDHDYLATLGSVPVTIPPSASRTHPSVFPSPAASACRPGTPTPVPRP